MNNTVFAIAMAVIATIAPLSATGQTIPEAKISAPTGSIGIHGYVDLGLPSGTLWANRNLAADHPYSLGMKYAWAQHTIFFGTYMQDPIANFAGNAAYDASTADWGKEWQIPSLSQWKELQEVCKWTWSILGKDTKGYKIEGPNGRSIFIPAAGFSNGLRNGEVQEKGYYWTSTSATDEKGYYVEFDKKGATISQSYPAIGFSIRPVLKSEVSTGK